MSDQKKLWNEVYRSQTFDAVAALPSDFALEAMGYLQPPAKVLELGCGAGNDAAGFARAGFQVLATDFSEIAVSRNAVRWHHVSNLKFRVLDMRQPLALDNNMFDMAYARLSLHYFCDELTRALIREIHRVLQPGGYFCFLCKSVLDAQYGQGTRLEADMYETHGHVRHFFSEEYAQSVLNGLFDVELIVHQQQLFRRSDSAAIAVVKAVAKAVKSKAEDARLTAPACPA